MTVNLQICGRVQGVFFRKTAKSEADKLGITGWARNNDDGSVEVLAVGDKKKLDEFIKWCKEGPEMARVDRVDEKWSNKSSDLEGFEAVD